MCRRIRRSSSPDLAVKSPPSNTMRPAVGSISLMTRRATVDLPDPDSPTMPRTSPVLTLSETSSTARNSLLPETKTFVSPVTERIEPSSVLTSVEGVMAGDNMVGSDACHCRLFACTDRRRARTARMKATARRGMDQVGDCAGNGFEALMIAPDVRQGCKQALGIRMTRACQDVVSRSLLDNDTRI